jgi:hypothetical protein
VQRRRGRRELERRTHLEPEQIHVDALEALGVRGPLEVGVDPAIEVEAGALELGDLGPRRRATGEVDGESAEAAVVVEAALRPRRAGGGSDGSDEGGEEDEEWASHHVRWGGG